MTKAQGRAPLGFFHFVCYDSAMLALIVVLALFAAAAGTGACVFFAHHLRHKQRSQFTADDAPPTRREQREAEANARESKTNLIYAGMCGGTAAVLMVAVVVLAANVKGTPPDTRPRDETAGGARTEENGPFGRSPTAPAVRQFDAEGLPVGNDFDAVLHRMNVRFQQGNTHLYGLELANMRYLKEKTAFARNREAFLAFQAHAGTPAAPPPFIGMVSDAWRELLKYATRDEVPDLCRLLATQPVESRQADVLNKLGEFNDPRCAASVAPFLMVERHRATAGHLLRKFECEKLVIPYLASNLHRDVRCEAVNILSAVGAIDSARAIKPLTRDPEIFVKLQAATAFKTLGPKFGVGHDPLAVVADLKASAADGQRFHTCKEQLEAAFHPNPPQRAAVFKALLACCKFPDPKNDTATQLHLAMKWASADDIKTVCEALVASEGSWSVFKKLQELKDVRSAETVAMFLTKPLLKDEATKTLQAIGPGAMKAVAVYAVPAYPNGAPIDLFTRFAAIDALGEIGTRECVPLLQQIGTAQLDYRDKALQAINRILARGM